jgi:hypothetical protein
MEYLSNIFNKLSITSNFVLDRISAFRPAAPRPDPEAIERHKHTILRAMEKYLYPFEIKRITSEYRRSTVNEESVLEDFFTGDIQPHTVPKDQHYYAGLAKVTELFKPLKPCRPAHILDVEHHYPMKRSTNAEPPFSTEPFFLDMLRSDTYRERNNLPENAKASTGNMKPIIFDFTRRWHHEIKEGTVPINAHIYYMLLHSKTALIKDDDPNKMRTIWGSPKPFVIAEIMFYWALLASYKRWPKLSAMLWGFETVLGGWFRLNAELFRSHMRYSIIMFDWKRFDKYALFSVFDDLDAMTRSFLDFSRGYLPTREYPDTESTWTPAKAARLERLWQWTLYAFRNTPIVLPDGRVFSRLFAGIPSGLYTTQYRDSIYNAMMICVCLSAMGLLSMIGNVFRVQGDDSLFQLAIFIPPNMHRDFLDQFQNLADYYFNSILNVDKSKISNSPNGAEVLSYTNHNGLPHRDHISLLAQFYHTKASKPTPSKTMAAAVGFAYASAGMHHPTYNVLKDVYDYYLSKGYTPDSAGLGSIFPSDPETLLTIQVDHFPSYHEIWSNLFRYGDNEPPTMQHFYPESHFLTFF